MSLRRNYKVRALALDLGLKASENPVRDILRFCEKRIQRFLHDFPECASLTRLLELSASKLGTRFVEIHSDTELDEVRTRYLQQGEKAFVTIREDLAEDVFGVTFKRTNRKSWELPYVSVIDCRGQKKFRAYYTKWHELGHLLILTDQMRLAFRRTHFGLEDKDPEEALVDVIAGNFGFLPEFIRPFAKGPASFEHIERLRMKLCPEASQQSSLIGIAKAWPTPCILIDAQVALRKGEQRELRQGAFTFSDAPEAVLRAVQVTQNDAARATNLVIFPNMRIPERSVISSIFKSSDGARDAIEDLSWWESSDGSRLPARKVSVQARKSWDGVQALITPSKQT